uniref:Uncharacterized protein n=1 Tax=Oryzias melastigma TaxID=30732 RepID=A0A3B3CQX9_ORYME
MLSLSQKGVLCQTYHPLLSTLWVCITFNWAGCQTRSLSAAQVDISGAWKSAGTARTTPAWLLTKAPPSQTACSRGRRSFSSGTCFMWQDFSLFATSGTNNVWQSG